MKTYTHLVFDIDGTLLDSQNRVPVKTREAILELEQRGQKADYEEVLADIRQRDYNDSHRAAAPLRQAEDAVLVDTTEDDFEAAFQKLCALIRGRIG